MPIDIEIGKDFFASMIVYSRGFWLLLFQRRFIFIILLTYLFC